jgi:hypothetical protein
MGLGGRHGWPFAEVEREEACYHPGMTSTVEPLTISLETWLTEHPGFHRPIEIADALGVDVGITARRLIYLAKNGRVLRKRGGPTNGPGSSTYSV